MHLLVVLSILSLRERFISSQPAHGVVQRSRLVKLRSVSLHTFTHVKWALLTLLARRQVTLPHCAIPLRSECHSILPFGMQPRWYYKSIPQARKRQVLALEGQRHVHTSVHTGAHTHTLPTQELSAWAPNSNTRLGLGRFHFSKVGIRNCQEGTMCLLPLPVNAEILYSLINAASVQLEFGTEPYRRCRTQHVFIND